MRGPLLPLCLGLLVWCGAAAGASPLSQEPGERAPVPPAPAETPAVGLEVGRLLPDLELMRVDGTGSLRLSELRGRRVLLLVFASW